MDYNFAERMKGVKGSAIREIFKMTGDPTVISFAGGNPAPEMFPAKELSILSQKILTENPTLALQYGITEGYAPLIEEVNKRLLREFALNPFEQTIIVSGGQQGIEHTAKVLVNEGDTVICEQPSFIGALNAFRTFNANLVGIPVESDGMNVDILEEKINNSKNVKLIYTIPNFQNPSGITMSYEKRQRLIEIAKKHNIVVIEDNPYGELRFSGTAVPTIKSLDTGGIVVYIGSFSKILSPGLRIGFMRAHSDIIEKVVVAKQVSDVHTNIFAQLLVYEYLKAYNIDDYIVKIRELYGRRCGFMLSCMDKYFPENITYTRPKGGIFIWCTMPQGYDTMQIVKKCSEQKVVFVPGSTFMVDIDKPSNAFRLNYSTMNEERIEQGIKILGRELSIQIIGGIYG